MTFDACAAGELDVPSLSMDSHLRLLRVAALVTCVLVGLPVLLRAPQDAVNFATWCVAFTILGISIALSFNATARIAIVHLAIQSTCVIVMVRVLCNGFEGTLLVIVAMQLGRLVTRREGLLWIAVQSSWLFWGIATHWTPRAAILLAPPYIGFQLLAFFTFQILADLAQKNAELTAMQQMFADASRIAERLRISQELHDALGHHLTALSLNLETAAHQAPEPAKANVRKAQALARLLLGDVREIVNALGKSGIEVEPALQTLTTGVPRPVIHLNVPAGLTVVDPERAHVLIRCAQEIITNSIRHSGADNLWIDVVATADRVEVRARDDGHGAREVHSGHGLSGMRGRLAAIGGSLEVQTEPGTGFSVIALLPYAPVNA